MLEPGVGIGPKETLATLRVDDEAGELLALHLLLVGPGVVQGPEGLHAVFAVERELHVVAGSACRFAGSDIGHGCIPPAVQG